MITIKKIRKGRIIYENLKLVITTTPIIIIIIMMIASNCNNTTIADKNLKGENNYQC